MGKIIGHKKILEGRNNETVNSNNLGLRNEYFGHV